jgi:phenol 2-monooxygenase
MNTGLHDACNLGWKLSMVLRGQAYPSLLHTYEAERLPNVQKLINYDKDISKLMTMQLPEPWKSDPNADPNEILGVVMEEASTFTSGLSIAFPINEVNVKGSFVASLDPAPVSPGQRGPDVWLQKPGTKETTRLQAQTPNAAKFYIIIFAGEPTSTSPGLKAFSQAVQSSKSFSNPTLPISWLVIPAKTGPSAFELLGIAPLGKVFYDETQTAHLRWGVSLDEGGVFVVRPDGWVATATKLDLSAVVELEEYFKKIFQ